MTLATPSAGAPGRSERPAVALSLGKFDGLHLGHQRIARRLAKAAGELGCASLALVLHPHPAQVLSGRRIPLLTSPQDRLDGLRALGLDRAEVLAFTPEVAAMPAAAFLAALQSRYDVRAMVVGPDFAFGRGREGDLGRLRELASEQGFGVMVASPVIRQGLPVSSARIRGLLAAGDVRAARRWMGHPPYLVGEVVHGAKRGGPLGFPTANLGLADDFVVPPNGVYTVRATWDGIRGMAGGRGWVGGAAAIGVRPMFDHGERSIEVHLIDFEGDLYGRELRVELLTHQRAEAVFPSLDALLGQMRADVARARRELHRAGALEASAAEE